jgi:hypothetical protein
MLLHMAKKSPAIRNDMVRAANLASAGFQLSPAILRVLAGPI